MAQSVRYLENIPVRKMDLSTTDSGIKINIVGLSGDAIRTCIYYAIEDNPEDYQVGEAFITDDTGRAYSLISVMRKVVEGEKVSWMEFGPIKPDASFIELHITFLRHSPSPFGFKIRGRNFIDPWDPELNLTRDLVKKMDSWLTQPGETSFDPDWEKAGAWNYKIEMGSWQDEHFDVIKPVDFVIDLGEEKIHIREFRNSNTGALVICETFSKTIENMDGSFKEKLFTAFKESETAGKFALSLSELGLKLSDEHARVTLCLKEKERETTHTPDYREVRGIIHNRQYHFFDHCVCSKDLDILVDTIRNIKIKPVLTHTFDLAHFSSHEDLEIDLTPGELMVKGIVRFDDIEFTSEDIRVYYESEAKGNIEDILINGVKLSIIDESGDIREFPSLGRKIWLDPGSEKQKQVIIFPAFHESAGHHPQTAEIIINSIDVKFKDPYKFNFKTKASPCCKKEI